MVCVCLLADFGDDHDPVQVVDQPQQLAEGMEFDFALLAGLRILELGEQDGVCVFVG